MTSGRISSLVMSTRKPTVPPSQPKLVFFLSFRSDVLGLAQAWASAGGRAPQGSLLAGGRFISSIKTGLEEKQQRETSETDRRVWSELTGLPNAPLMTQSFLKTLPANERQTRLLSVWKSQHSGSRLAGMKGQERSGKLCPDCIHETPRLSDWTRKTTSCCSLQSSRTPTAATRNLWSTWRKPTHGHIS